MLKTVFNRIVLLLSALSLAAAGLALGDFILHPLAGDYVFHSSLYRALVVLVFIPLTLLVGFLIMRRVPGNIVGPLLIVWSSAVTLSSIRPEITPLLFAVFDFLDFFGWLGFFLMLLHFPDGKIYPPGAAPWIHRLVVLSIPFVSLMFLSTATFRTSSRMANPFYLPALQPAAGLIPILGVFFFSPILIMALVSPALRFRRGSLRERLQIKWLALFAGFSVTYVFLLLIGYPILTGGEVMDPGSGLLAVIFYLSVDLFPLLSISIAVLRHRLWDIDILIRRTLVYGILTAALALVYFGLVTVLQALISSISNQQSPISNVLSTLAIAALFTPLRRRIQSLIDRRFYRRQYNAERVLAAFSLTLRDEVDLEHLKGSILDVVEETMQPAHVSVWLRDGGVPRPFA